MPAKITVGLAVMGALIALQAAPALARQEEAAGLGVRGAAAGTQARLQEDADGGEAHPVARAIADHQGVSVDEVESLFERGLGFGEVARAYALSDESSLTVDEIADAILEQPGWGRYIRSLDLAQGKADRSLGQIMRGARAAGRGKGP